eukprot:gene18893-biopygen3976
MRGARDAHGACTAHIVDHVAERQHCVHRTRIAFRRHHIAPTLRTPYSHCATSRHHSVHCRHCSALRPQCAYCDRNALTLHHTAATLRTLSTVRHMTATSRSISEARRHGRREGSFPHRDIGILFAGGVPSSVDTSSATTSRRRTCGSQCCLPRVVPSTPLSTRALLGGAPFPGFHWVSQAPQAWCRGVPVFLVAFSLQCSGKPWSAVECRPSVPWSISETQRNT